MKETGCKKYVIKTIMKESNKAGIKKLETISNATVFKSSSSMQETFLSWKDSILKPEKVNVPH